MKSSVAQIQARFDGEVERFSNLDTGQSATVDAPLALELIAEAAAAVCPHATDLLDIGCGAGNYSLKLLQQLPRLRVTLLDLSPAMLERAATRVGAVSELPVRARQGDIREVDLSEGSLDIVTAGAVLHHLRTEEEWRTTFARIYRALRPGGSFWVSDLVAHDDPRIQALLWRRYGEYLAGFKGGEYRDRVFTYIEQEDTPQTLGFQLDLLREVGFTSVDVLHKNACFATFGGCRGT